MKNKEKKDSIIPKEAVIEINEEKRFARINIELPLQGDEEKKRSYSTSDATAWLKEKGYEIYDIIHPFVVTNTSDRRKKGFWLFKLKLEKTESYEFKPRSKRTRKVKNEVDKIDDGFKDLEKEVKEKK